MRKIVSKDSNYPKKATLLDIILYPHPVLKQMAEPVTVFDAHLKQFCQNMVKTMYHAPGIGLAAPQVGVSKRIFICDVNYDRIKLGPEDEPEHAQDIELTDLDPFVFINPEIVETQGETTYEEGCLSLPGIFDTVHRHKKIEIQYQDLKGRKKYLTLDDLFSICAQHELDHLNGVLFIEKLAPEKFKHYQELMIERQKQSLKS
jgi:peptide deformylase